MSKDLQRSPLAVLAVAVLYLGLALIATYPLVVQPFDHVIGFSKEVVVPAATPPLSIWSMSVVSHNLRDPFHLFDGNAFYPYQDTLAFSEHLFVPALVFGPLKALTGNPVLAYNVVVLLTLAVGALGMNLLAFEITGEPIAAFGAGLLYAFHTWNVNEIQRLQILSNEFFPFVLLGLVRYFAAPSLGRAAYAALFYLLQALSCMYWALYLPFVVGAALLVLEWRERLPLSRLLHLLAGLAVACALVVPFALPYIRTGHELGFARPLPESLLLARYFQVLSGSLLYRHLLGTALPNQNAAHFLGFSALILAGVGFAPSRLRGLWAGLLLAGFLLSLGPDIMLSSGHVLFPAPYRLLRGLVPGFRNVRYPERLSLILVLGLCPLVALGLARLRPRLGQAGTLVLASLLFLEHLAWPQPLSFLPSGAGVPKVYSYLQSEKTVKVVAEVPAAPCRMERADALPMYFSTFHFKRIVEGYTSYFPPTYNFMKWRLFHFPDPESVAFLQAFGVDTIVVQPEGSFLVHPDPRWEIVGPFPEGHFVLRLSGFRGAPPLPEEGAYKEVPREGWQARGTSPGALLAIDGDPQTAWVSGPAQKRGEFFELLLPFPVEVDRISLDVHCFVHQAEEFPTHLEILTRSGEGWSRLPFDGEASYERFFVRLLKDPRHATLDFDIPHTRVQRLKLRITEEEPFGIPWTISELRLFARR